MKTISTLLLLVSLTSCVGLRETDDHFTAHAETFNLLGLQIPHNDHEAAWGEVPEGAEVETVRSAPSDWSSAVGIMNRILGFSYTEISGTKK